VVGPAGEEIFTDKFGRVKVQFYWDRYGKKDDHSSCWVRVAFLSAGGGWGAVAIPRIGYEVVVQFIDGDPDRPLVTGCVYNSRNMPPLSDAGTGSTPPDMPGAKTMTTLRSQSFGKTGGYNEITMNDTQGAETLFIKAQYDEIHKVGHDRKDSVINDVTTTIGNNETVSVGKDRSTTIGNNDTLSISNNHSAKIGNNHSTSIQGNRSLTITGNDSVSVTGNRDESMTGNLSETGMQVTITGQTMLTLQCGGSTIQMTPASISIKAPMVMIN
jgi:type VI secretion system secreted protein VgrG